MSSPVTVWRHHKKIKNYLGKIGKVIVWTKVFMAPAGFDHEAPYFVALVEFADKQRMPLQIVDFEEGNLPAGREGLKPNQKIITVVRRLGKVKLDEVIEYGIKAKPL